MAGAKIFVSFSQMSALEHVRFKKVLLYTPNVRKFWEFRAARHIIMHYISMNVLAECNTFPVS